MGGKGSGGYDAGPMMEYGDKALALQREMYDDSVARTQPYYDTGTAGLGMLADLLGINGGSKKTRDQIYNEMLPQYTKTQETTSDNAFFISPDGKVIDFSKNGLELFGTGDGHGPYWNAGDDMKAAYTAYARGGDPTQFGFKPMNPTTSQEVIDYSGLNSAVDQRFGAQGTPDNFGSLLQPFDLNKFQADPGYQFRMDQGQKAIERAAAARGQYYDPSTVKALNDYSSNMADQTFGDAYNRYNNDQQNIFNRLAAISGIGQTATGSLNNAGQNYADQGSSIFGQVGSAITEANAANASRPSMFSSLLGAGLQIGGMGTGTIFGKALGF